MKKVLLKFWSFITSNYLQSILGFIAFLSWYEAYDLGHNSNGHITSGYDGGALAMGLITCACLISIVWLEVNKSKLRK